MKITQLLLIIMMSLAAGSALAHACFGDWKSFLVLSMVSVLTGLILIKLNKHK